MTWKRDHLFGTETYDAMRARVLADLDLPEHGPQAGFDEARAERFNDYTPSSRGVVSAGACLLPPRDRLVSASPEHASSRPADAAFREEQEAG